MYQANQSLNYKPITFFLLTFLFTYVTWFIAVYISYQSCLALLVPFILIGMGGPSIAALSMLIHTKNKNMWVDFYQRLQPNKIRITFIPFIFLFIPFMVICAIAVSSLLGLSTKGFLFAQLPPDQALGNMGFIAILFVVILSCSLEEIGWRGYGIESLKSKFNLWKTSIIFAFLWSLWHIPAFFIRNGYFQQEVLQLGFVQTIVYFATLFPLTFLINWAYVKNNRSILAAILMHAILNFSVALFQIEPVTKIVFMILLFVAAVIVVTKDKELFFKN